MQQQSMLAPEIADDDISNLTFDSEFDDEVEEIDDDDEQEKAENNSGKKQAETPAESAPRIGGSAPNDGKKAPETDVPKIKTGSALRHNKFGEGIVKALDGKHIIVDFNGIEKEFPFPDALVKGFLRTEQE